MDHISLKGRSILITGGTVGIGYGIAEHLLRLGCNVAITGRTESKIADALTGLSKISSGKVIGIKGDVRFLSEMKLVVEEIVSAFGALGVVVANAGLGKFANIETITELQWSETIDTNLTGVFNTVKASINPLKKSKGYIITIASLAGTYFFANGSAYNASKFGLIGFSQSIMLDLRKYDIKVTTIMPGSVTSYFAGHTSDENDGWKIQPEDIGQMVADLMRMNPRVLPSKIEVRPAKPPKS